jgi:hypothetical protein
MEKNLKREKPSIVVGTLVKVENIGPDYEPGSEIFLGRVGQVVRTKWGRCYVQFADDSEGIFKLEDLSTI